MVGTKIKTIKASLQKTEEWIHDLQKELGWEDENEAYKVLRAVLHALRDRLSIDENAHISAQLPLILRGLYFEGWKPAATPMKVRELAEFLDRVCLHASDSPLVEQEVESLTRAVFRVLRHHLSEGLIEGIRKQWPLPLQSLWPDRPGAEIEG